MKRALISLTVLPLVAACTVPVPAVSQYNGDSVSVQVDSSVEYLPAEQKAQILSDMQQQADDICLRGHKKRAEYTSHIVKPTGTYTAVIERLYLCLN